jgi:branched-chain amino acid transport system ATP-binding protein
MATGAMVLAGNSKDLMNDDRIKAAYLGGVCDAGFGS